MKIAVFVNEVGSIDVDSLLVNLKQVLVLHYRYFLVPSVWETDVLSCWRLPCMHYLC